jgi:hypothetical protein
MIRTKQIDNKVAQLIAQGGVVVEYKSIWQLLTNDKTFKYFSGAETSAVKPLARYNFTGKNPADSKEATIVAFSFEATDANESAVDRSTPTQTYAKLASLTSLLNQAYYTIKQNKTTLREGFVSKIHQPIPRIFRPLLTGSVTNVSTPVAVSEIAGSNIEHKNEKHALFLPIDLKSDGEVLDIQVNLPSGGFTVDANLNNSLLILHALAVEFPSGRAK